MGKRNIETSRFNRGFTMMEMLIVVAMLLILGGLVMMSLANAQKNLYRLEMDGIAKEIYIAAQNHLSTAKAEGTLDRLDKGTPGTATGDADNGVYYYVLQENSTSFIPASNSVLSRMLPFGSIDDSVRLGGSYVVRYQVKGEIARVLDVFYADPRGRYPAQFSTDSYKTLVPDYIGSGSTPSNLRLNYQGSGIIGWWGGDEGVSPALPEGQLTPPTIRVINAERLRVIVDDTNDFGWASLQLEVRGVTSGAKMIIPLRKVTSSTVPVQATSGAGVDEFRPNTNEPQYVIDLDDITSTGGYPANPNSSGHFADIASSSYLDPTPTAAGSSEGGALENAAPLSFIPGEDIEIQAIAYTTLRLATEARSATVITNSLFDSITEVVDAGTNSDADADAENSDDAGVGTTADEGANADEPANAGTTIGTTATTSQYAVVISNIRHLENLDKGISGFENSGLSSGGTSIPTITAAQQVSNLSWTEYLSAIRMQYTNDSGTGVTGQDATESSSDDSRTVIVTKLKKASPAADNTFMPVNPSFSLEYEGNAFRVSDIVVSAVGNAGLFGALNDGSVKNLELINFNVESKGDGTDASGLEPAEGVDSTDGNAGALAGSISGTNVLGVLARNELASSDESDSGLEIAGTANVGGLIGSMNGGSIDACAAAVYVNSADDAGGLVGVVSGNATITNSYAGGHTVNGIYSDSTSDNGRLNVQAGANAGGLMGVFDGSSISNCYSTCSASGESTAGGLVGDLSGGSVTNSYATGLVKGPAGSTGAFIGKSEATVGNGNYYLDFLDKDNYGDENRPAIGNKTKPAGISLIDKDTDSYKDYIKNSKGSAVCYDSALSSRYGGTYPNATNYPYKNISELPDASVPNTLVLSAHMTTHYGDWPSPGTLVVNK